MDKDSLLETKLPDEREVLVTAEGNTQPHGATRTIKRENDSMDDFEHLEHEGSPLDDTSKNILDVTSVQLIDVPRGPPASSRITELSDVASKLERNILDTSIPVDERILQPVPATPPPSADFEKFDDVTSAQTLLRFDAQDGKHRQQHQVNEIRQVDPKVATMAFMDTERSSGDYHNQREIQHSDDEADDDLSQEDVKQHLDNRHDDLVEDREIIEPHDAPQDFTEEMKNEAGNLTARLAPDKTSSTNENFGLGDFDSMEKKINEFPEPIKTTSDDYKSGYIGNIESSVIPGPQKSPEFDFLADETAAETKKITKETTRNLMDDDTWNVVEKPELQQRAASANFASREAEEAEKTAKVEREFYEAPTKPLPPLPKSEMDDDFGRRTDFDRERVNEDKFEMSNDDFIGSGGVDSSTQRGQKNRSQQQQQQSGTETGDSEFESAPEQSPAKSSARSAAGNSSSQHGRKINADDIAPKEIFTDMGLDAWFNPERLNPKVAALIYWRQPEKTGIVFGAILGVLLSLAYFSLISVFAYLSLLTLTGTVGFRVYKTFMQAVQKTSDGHPFKDILEVDLTLPSEKVHEVADVAVAHANAAVAELRRLFLVEDFIDSLKFGVLLWCFTYLGSWFNGMTLIIIGVVALFTLPKVYETNKAQIDQNVALVHGKINEITAKVKAAIPLGKKSEPTKEE